MNKYDIQPSTSESSNTSEIVEVPTVPPDTEPKISAPDRPPVLNKQKRKILALTGVSLVLLALIIGGILYAVQDRKPNQATTQNQVTSESTQIENNSQDNASVSEAEPPDSELTDITFQEKLGISMTILPGWEVKGYLTKNKNGNFYSWTVEKSGADGKIRLSSYGFEGGFHGCEEPGSLTEAAVKDIATTQNSNLMFMSWSYTYSGETRDFIDIVRSDEKNFQTTNDSSATKLSNSDVKAGNYFFCLSDPLPGFSLELNNEESGDLARLDRISAYSASSSENKHVPLAPTAQSYADIKTMLTSIK